MNKNLLAALRKFLLLWGALSLIAVLGLGIFIANQLYADSQHHTDTATVQDVRFVLNACGLDANRIERVMHSEVSARTFTGDYLDAYAIKLTRLEIAELMSRNNAPSRPWNRGDRLPSIVSDAIDFAGTSGISWFPQVSELKSESIYVYPVSILTHGIQPTAAELIFVRPADRMVFYFGSKT